MIRRLLIGLATAAALILPGIALAQTAVVVSSCGALAYSTGYQSPQTMDASGNLCTSAGSSTGSGVVAQGSTTSGQTGILTQGAVITAPPTYTTAQTSPLSIQPIGGGLRIVPSVPDGTITGSPPPSIMMGAWNATTGGTAAIRLGANGAMGVSLSSLYPYNTSTSVISTAVTGTSGNVANASAAATLPATASVTNYASGIQCTAAGSTAAAVVTAALTGTITGTNSYTFVFPAGATVQATPLVVSFSPPVPASAANTAITITLPAGGAGNTNAVCNIQGFRY